MFRGWGCRNDISCRERRAEAVGSLLQVNSFGSLAQAVVVFLLLPGLAALRGISPGQLPQYLQEGVGHCLCSSMQALSSMLLSGSIPLHVYRQNSQILGAGRAASHMSAMMLSISMSSSGNDSMRASPINYLPKVKHDLGAGFQCLTGTTPACASTDCGQAPVVALAYVACNLGLNISALALLRTAGLLIMAAALTITCHVKLTQSLSVTARCALPGTWANYGRHMKQQPHNTKPSVHAGNVVQSLSFSCVVPLTIWAFTFDWPLLDPAPALGSKFVLGTGVNAAQQRKHEVLVVSSLSVCANMSSCCFAGSFSF